jgi:hypothetical protein
MSIRLIARDLYRLQREVDALEKRLSEAPLEEVEAVREKLRKAKAEMIRMRNVLDGRIDRPKRPLH